MAKYTPGIWEIDHGALSVCGQIVALPFGPDHATVGERAANLRLAASAPALYAALQNMIARAVWGEEIGEDIPEERMDPQFRRELAEARAAIAKAEGR